MRSVHAHLQPPTRPQAWWAHLQGLDGSLRGSTPAAILQRTGWARSVGGVGPYLTLFSRGAVTRQQADDAVAQLQIHELPSARACTYVVPAPDFGLAMALGRQTGEPEAKTARALGVTDDEIAALCAAVLAALEQGPLEPDAIRAAVGDRTRSLGEAGKKKGVTTTLPVALGLLQGQGDIRRVPVNGRLDQQRYRYVRWRDSPRQMQPLSDPEAHRALAQRYFSQVGPATLAEFEWFSGLTKKAVTQAVADLGLVPCEPGSDRLLPPQLIEAYQQFQVPEQPHFCLISSLDPLSANRRDVATLLAPEDRARAVVQPGPGTTLSDLPHHAIVDRGRIVGFWQFDVEAGAIVWHSFVGDHPQLREAIAATEVFVRDQLGDARSFSLDSPKSRAPKLAELRHLHAAEAAH